MYITYQVTTKYYTIYINYAIKPLSSIHYRLYIFHNRNSQSAIHQILSINPQWSAPNTECSLSPWRLSNAEFFHKPTVEVT